MHLKIVKIHFHKVPPLVHSGQQNTQLSQMFDCNIFFLQNSKIEDPYIYTIIAMNKLNSNTF